MSEHIDTKHKLKSICDIKTFEELLDHCVLTEEDKTLIRLHYLQEKELNFIADKLGFSESTVKRKHKKILAKLNKLL